MYLKIFFLRTTVPEITKQAFSDRVDSKFWKPWPSDLYQGPKRGSKFNLEVYWENQELHCYNLCDYNASIPEVDWKLFKPSPWTKTWVPGGDLT